MPNCSIKADVANNLANPCTGAVLSWYIISPCIEAEVKLKLDAMDLDLAFIYAPEKWWKSPETGVENPMYVKMMTTIGVFFTSG